jgi:hypothetical protein
MVLASMVVEGRRIVAILEGIPVQLVVLEDKWNCYWPAKQGFPQVHDYNLLLEANIEVQVVGNKGFAVEGYFALDNVD